MIGFAISNARIPELAGAAARINQLLAEGALTLRSIEVLPLQATADAHKWLDTGRAHGTRLILHP